MDNNTLIITVVFAAVFGIAYVADVFKYRVLQDAMKTYVDVTLPRVDVALAEYGDQLKPAHDIFVAALTLIDQDSDTLVQMLPPSAVAKLRELFGVAEMVTDGEVEPEALNDTPPAGELRQ